MVTSSVVVKADLITINDLEFAVIILTCAATIVAARELSDLPAGGYPVALFKSSWIRPVPVFGGKGVIVDFPPPAKNGKSVLASTIARKKPCPIEDTIAILTGVPSPNATGESNNNSNLKVTSSGGSKKGGIVPDFKVTATGSGGAQFKVTAA